MGIYIRDTEKPKSCGECKFFCGLGYGFHCYLNGKHITFIGEIEDFCPLIEIVRCGECKKVDTKKCPMYSAGWGYTDDDWCSEGERRADEGIIK